MRESLPLQLMQTYGAYQPRSTHYRPATCAEVGCVAHARGWVTRVPRGSELVDMVASLRFKYRFREIDSGDPATRAFAFEAGQRCLRADTHRVALERPALFIVKAGRPGSFIGLRRRHLNADDWAEDFAGNQDRLSHTLLGTP